MNLPESKIQELKSRHKKERDKGICDRIKAVLLINDGYSYEDIAKILLLDDFSVRRHIDEFIKSEKLCNNHNVSEPKLNSQVTLELISYLQSVTFVNVKPIIEYVQTKYGISYRKSGMTNWLKENGFRYKNPHSVPSRSSYLTHN